MNARYLDACEKLDWSVHKDDGGMVELETYSPAGENFIIAVEVEGFADNIKAYAAGFDIDEHIAMWIAAKQNGVRGVPSARELVHDAEYIKKMLQELAAALLTAQAHILAEGEDDD